MTVREMIEKLGDCPQDAEVMIEVENDSCDLCSHLKKEKCSLAGKFSQFAEQPYYHAASDEVRIGTY